MSNEVQFEIDNESRPQYKTAGSTFAQFVMKFSGGIVKDETQANYVLIGFVVVALLISYFILSSGSAMPYQPSQQQILQAMQPPSAHQ